MKKLFLILFFIVSTLFVKAQTSYKVIEIRYEKYENNVWVVKKTTKTDSVYVIIDDFNIKITNQDDSTFEMSGKPSISKYKTHKSYIWRTYDKDNKFIVIMFKTDLKLNNLIEMAILRKGNCLDYKF